MAGKQPKLLQPPTFWSWLVQLWLLSMCAAPKTCFGLICEFVHVKPQHAPTHHAFLSLFHALCPSLLPLVCATGCVLLVKLVVPIVARPIDAFQLWQKNKCQTLACIHGDKLRVQNSHHAADGGRGLVAKAKG